MWFLFGTVWNEWLPHSLFFSSIFPRVVFVILIPKIIHASNNLHYTSEQTYVYLFWKSIYFDINGVLHNILRYEYVMQTETRSLKNSGWSCNWNGCPTTFWQEMYGLSTWLILRLVGIQNDWWISGISVKKILKDIHNV